MLRSNNIEEILSKISKLEEAHSSYMWGGWPTIAAAIAVASLTLAAALWIIAKHSKKAIIFDVSVWSGLLGIVFTVIAMSWAGIVNPSSNYFDRTEAHYELTDAYIDAVIEKYDVSDENPDNRADLIVNYVSDKTDETRVRDVTTGYNDLETMTRYDLTFIFDGKTHEPILLKSDTVTPELIEKLQK